MPNANTRAGCRGSNSILSKAVILNPAATRSNTSSERHIWFSETLEPGFRAADRTVSTAATALSTIDSSTKSTNLTGIFGVKITDKPRVQLFSRQIQGRQILAEYRLRTRSIFRRTRRLLPMGTLVSSQAFTPDTAENNAGSQRSCRSLDEGRSQTSGFNRHGFYNNKRVAATTDRNGGGATDEAHARSIRRLYDRAASMETLGIRLGNLLYDNGGSFNRSNIRWRLC